MAENTNSKVSIPQLIFIPKRDHVGDHDSEVGWRAPTLADLFVQPGSRRRRCNCRDRMARAYPRRLLCDEVIVCRARSRERRQDDRLFCPGLSGYFRRRLHRVRSPDSISRQDCGRARADGLRRSHSVFPLARALESADCLRLRGKNSSSDPDVLRDPWQLGNTLRRPSAGLPGGYGFLAEVHTDRVCAADADMGRVHYHRRLAIWKRRSRGCASQQEAGATNSLGTNSHGELMAAGLLRTAAISLYEPSPSVVVLESEVSDQLLAPQVAKRVL